MVTLRFAVVDCLAVGSDISRKATVDVIGVGPRLVVGILKGLGHEAELMTCRKALKSVRGVREYDILMVSGMAVDLPAMSKVVKAWTPIKAVAGGPAFTEYPKLLSSGYDAVIVGEAEAPLPKLVDYLRGVADLRSVPNIAYRVGGKVVRNPGPPYVPPEELWRFQPDVGSVTKYEYWRASRVYVEVVRGCSNYMRPYVTLADGTGCVFCDICRTGSLEERRYCPVNIPPGCGYCSVPSLFGPARSRPVKQVVKEVEELASLGVTRVVLSGPDFLDYGRDWLVAPKPLTDPRSPPANLEAIEDLLSELTSIPEVRSGRTHIMVENIKPNLVDGEVAKVLGRYLRGTPVYIGLETGDEELHKAIGRPSTVKEVLRAAELLREAGLRPYVYLIHGLPGETQATIKETVKVVKELFKLGVERFVLYRFTPIKGTAFEGFKRPPPAVRTHAKKLYFLVRKLNYEAKKRLLGEVVSAVVAGRSRGDTIAYTLPHGPVIRIKSELVRHDLNLGDLIKVKVIEVLNDREVLGEVLGAGN